MRRPTPAEWPLFSWSGIGTITLCIVTAMLMAARSWQAFHRCEHLGGYAFGLAAVCLIFLAWVLRGELATIRERAGNLKGK